jgi:DNA gyrase subunit A
VVGVEYIDDEENEVMIITQQGKVLRTEARDIRPIGRATQGVRLIEIDAEDRVVSIARLVERDGEEDAVLGD